MSRGGDEGTSLTGNLLNDLVNLVTQGEYTKYEDIPEAGAEGLITGWARPNEYYQIVYIPNRPAINAYLSLENSLYEFAKDATFERNLIDDGGTK